MQTGKGVFKALLVTVFVFSAVIVKANIDPANPETPVNKIREINGMIIDAETKKGLKEVKVTIYTASKKEKSVITDKTGKFAMNELKAGDYKLVFEKEGYLRHTLEKISIKPEETFQVNIELTEDTEMMFIASPFMILR